jgi:hypothetical protein
MSLLFLMTQTLWIFGISGKVSQGFTQHQFTSTPAPAPTVLHAKDIIETRHFHIEFRALLKSPSVVLHSYIQIKISSQVKSGFHSSLKLMF